MFKNKKNRRMKRVINHQRPCHLGAPISVSHFHIPMSHKRASCGLGSGEDITPTRMERQMVPRRNTEVFIEDKSCQIFS